jgi:hypothetical protein
MWFNPTKKNKLILQARVINQPQRIKIILINLNNEIYYQN